MLGSELLFYAILVVPVVIGVLIDLGCLYAGILRPLAVIALTSKAVPIVLWSWRMRVSDSHGMELACILPIVAFWILAMDVVLWQGWNTYWREGRS